MNNMFLIKDGVRLKCGYTTGSCATGAAKAAALMLINKNELDFINIDTPSGIELKLKVEKVRREENSVSCCITKDSGDDPDVTNKIEIFARVTMREDSRIVIEGGEGIGRITRSGFWGKEGEPAINPVPREMIKKELMKISTQGFNVLIFAPRGKEIALKTFNSNLGIVNGISIIGTKGIVEPMSEEALKKSIYIQIDDIYDRGIRELVLFPGNYGEGVVDKLELKGEKVKISNYIGDMLLYVKNKGFEKITLVGHIGKFCKLSLGVFNTHSKICDGRIEAFVYYLALCKAPINLINSVNECKNSEEALKIIKENNYEIAIEKMIEGLRVRVRRYLKDESLEVKIIMYSMEYGILGKGEVYD